MKSALVISTVLIVASGLFGNYFRFNSQMPDNPPSFGSIPYSANGYFGQERRFSDASYEVLKADTTTLRLYRASDGTPFWLFVAYFSSQQYGSQIHSPKHCLPGGGWRIEKQEPYHLHLPGGVSKEVNRVVIAEREKKQLMFYWFETRGGAISDEFGLKWGLMKNSLLLRPTDAAFIRLSVPLEQSTIEQTTARAVDFLSTFQIHLDVALPFNN
jgi:EpsI family protein